MTFRGLSHKLTAYFQAGLSVVFCYQYFTVLVMFLDGKVRVPGEYHDMIIALLGVLTGSVMTIVGFWFNRSRTSSDPEGPPDWNSLARWIAAHPGQPLPVGLQTPPANPQQPQPTTP